MPGAAQSSDELRAARIIASPWPHLIVDNFLATSVLAKSLTEINSDAYSFDIEKRGSGQIEYSLLKSKTLWRAIYSRRMIYLLSSAFEARVTLSRDNWIQLRRMNADTPEFPLHHDFVSTEDSIASFLYLSNGWVQECGGRLHLFRSEQDSTPSTSIAPLQNRFVAFQTKICHWHSVERVYGWERLSALALWDVNRPLPSS
jgi:2OG-Fe(II) oxygenase superfamily